MVDVAAASPQQRTPFACASGTRTAALRDRHGECRMSAAGRYRLPDGPLSVRVNGGKREPPQRRSLCRLRRPLRGRKHGRVASGNGARAWAGSPGYPQQAMPQAPALPAAVIVRDPRAGPDPPALGMALVQIDVRRARYRAANDHSDGVYNAGQPVSRNPTLPRRPKRPLITASLGPN